MLTRMAPPAGLKVAGNATVWQYLYKNKTCEFSAGVMLHATITKDGKPAAGASTTGSAASRRASSPIW